MGGLDFGKKNKKLSSSNVIASSGNRTRAARVAGEHSTTEPTTRTWLMEVSLEHTLMLGCIYIRIRYPEDTSHKRSA